MTLGTSWAETVPTAVTVIRAAANTATQGCILVMTRGEPVIEWTSMERALGVVTIVRPSDR
jgi:hypothetical protein